MIITCTIDNNYIRHCGVMLRSLFEANQGEDLHVYVVHGDLDPQQRGVLVSYLSRFLPSVSFLHVSADLLGDVPLHGHLTLATYFRLLFGTLLPAGVKRLIFLDSDMIVAGNLRELWEMPLQGQLFAAVIDHSQAENLARLNLNDAATYFNAGVLLIDLEAWRQEGVITKGLAYAIANPEKVIYCDQDVLNALFQGRFLPLPPRWNALPHLWDLSPGQSATGAGLSSTDREARQQPALVHFAGGGPAKPWHHHCRHPWAARYREILATTPWAGTPLEEAPPPPLVAWRDQLIFRGKWLVRGGMRRLQASLRGRVCLR